MKLVEIHLEDVELFFKLESEIDFVEAIKSNTKRYITLFSESADKCFPQRSIPLTTEEVKHDFFCF
jgi:hypothetical protein